MAVFGRGIPPPGRDHTVEGGCTVVCRGSVSLDAAVNTAVNRRL